MFAFVSVRFINSFMGTLIALLLLSISVPSFGLDEARYVHGKMPNSIDRDGTWVAANVELWVDVDGRVDICNLGVFVGDDQLAQRICPILADRKLDRGRGAEGQPSASRIRTRILVSPSDLPNLQTRMIASLDRVGGLFLLDSTANAEKEAKVTVAIEVAYDGSVKACDAGRKKADRRLIELACQMASERDHAVYRTGNGAAADYVTSFTVQFSKAA